MDAHLVLDAGAGHVVGLAERTVRIELALRNDEERDALDAFRRGRRAREDEVHDVIRVVVLTVGDENFLTGDPVVIALGNGLRLHLREVGARLRFREVHRAGPLAAHELRNERLLLLVGAAQQDRLDRALVEQRTVGECHVRRLPHLERGRAEQLRQPLPAVLGRHRKPDPARVGKLFERFLEPLGRRHRARIEVRALTVARRVDRIEHFGREVGRLFDDRFEQIGGLFVSRQLRDGVEIGDLANVEDEVAKRCLICCHKFLNSLRFRNE